MRRASCRLAALVVGIVLAACEAKEKGAAVGETVMLPPNVRAMIRSAMVDGIEPAFTLLWRRAYQDDLRQVPDAALALRVSAQSIRTELEQSQGVPPDMLALFDRMGAQADSIAAAAGSDDLPRTLTLIDRLRRGTCDGCHTRFHVHTGT